MGVVQLNPTKLKLPHELAEQFQTIVNLRKEFSSASGNVNIKWVDWKSQQPHRSVTVLTIAEIGSSTNPH